MASSDFDKLWAGQTVSLLGTALTVFALPALAVLNLHATPLQLGALLACGTLPFPILGMIAGVVADRFSRKKLMIIADVVRFAALATVPIAACTHVLGIPLLYAVALITGIASSFFGISYQSYLPVIVPRDGLMNANTKLEVSNSGSQVVGSALGGVLVQWVGGALAIAFDAVSYIVSVGTLMLIHREEPVHDGPPLSVGQGISEIAEGLRIVFHAPDFRWILFTTATTNFGRAMANAVVLIYGYRMLHLQPGPLGVIFGVASLGFVGALLSTRLRQQFGLRATLIGSILLCGLSTGCVLFGSISSPYVVFFITSAIAAISVPIYNVNQVSYRQALVDVHLQGRLNATMRTFVSGTVPFGQLLGGYVGSVVGITQTILLGAVISTIAALWLIPLRERSPVAPR